MKSKVVLAASIFSFAFFMTSCDKEECHECHYEDAYDQEVELGEKCGEELEEVEKNGVTVDGESYEVHCHEH